LKTFDRVLIVDWSGGNDRGPSPKADAIWAAFDDTPAVYFRHRQALERWLNAALEAELDAGHRVFLGFDFPFGLPTGMAKPITGQDDPFAFWNWVTKRVEDTPKRNNRFDVGAEANRNFEGIGPFWGNGLARDIDDLPRKGRSRTAQVTERRLAEANAKGAFPVWQLAGAGSVGSQMIMGLPVLQRLRLKFGENISIWPFEDRDTPLKVVEVWPSLTVQSPPPEGKVKDAWQVESVARQIASLSPIIQYDLLYEDIPDAARAKEGWIFGLGQKALMMATDLKPPPLSNDCFALPLGHKWTPVEDAWKILQDRLRCVVPQQTTPLSESQGHVLAKDVVALRSHPPAANAAVDGYGFAQSSLTVGDQLLPLHPGRAAAGAPLQGSVPEGFGVRVLTGAIIPEGVDTLVLEEDCAINDTHIAFRAPVKKGANMRRAGEDSIEGETVLLSGQILRPQDIALAASVGVGELTTFARLRIGVLSTGDELATPGTSANTAQVYDANSPMLVGLARSWGCAALDLGHAPDDRDALRKILNDASEDCDMILTSGGASAGDEDHVSAVLEETGSMALWRIALKPGRPLALGIWNGTPVFGLPGNPVAAFVCALLFGYPSARLLAGAGWNKPIGYSVPAAFKKSKREGRREYYRARLNAEGQAEVFASEGSGRVSGLSWATGLIEMGFDAENVNPGDAVRFLPFTEFGI
jgi:molybdopterin molybdotransferase